MSKAEKFIQSYTNNCSNEIWSPYPQINNDVRKIDGEPAKEFSPWITPDQAKRAVEIAREEVIEETAEWLTKHAKKYYFNKERYLGTEELVEDYKLIMSMKDEKKNI